MKIEGLYQIVGSYTNAVVKDVKGIFKIINKALGSLSQGFNSKQPSNTEGFEREFSHLTYVFGEEATAPIDRYCGGILGAQAPQKDAPDGELDLASERKQFLERFASLERQEIDALISRLPAQSSHVDCLIDVEEKIERFEGDFGPASSELVDEIRLVKYDAVREICFPQVDAGEIENAFFSLEESEQGEVLDFALWHLMHPSAISIGNSEDEPIQVPAHLQKFYLHAQGKILEHVVDSGSTIESEGALEAEKPATKEPKRQAVSLGSKFNRLVIKLLYKLPFYMRTTKIRLAEAAYGQTYLHYTKESAAREELRQKTLSDYIDLHLERVEIDDDAKESVKSAIKNYYQGVRNDLIERLSPHNNNIPETMSISTIVELIKFQSWLQRDHPEGYPKIRIGEIALKIPGSERTAFIDLATKLLPQKDDAESKTERTLILEMFGIEDKEQEFSEEFEWMVEIKPEKRSEYYYFRALAKELLGELSDPQGYQIANDGNLVKLRNEIRASTSVFIDFEEMLSGDDKSIACVLRAFDQIENPDSTMAKRWRSAIVEICYKEKLEGELTLLKGKIAAGQPLDVIQSSLEKMMCILAFVANQLTEDDEYVGIMRELVNQYDEILGMKEVGSAFAKIVNKAFLAIDHEFKDWYIGEVHHLDGGGRPESIAKRGYGYNSDEALNSQKSMNRTGVCQKISDVSKMLESGQELTIGMLEQLYRANNVKVMPKRFSKIRVTNEFNVRFGKRIGLDGADVEPALQRVLDRVNKMLRKGVPKNPFSRLMWAIQVAKFHNEILDIHPFIDRNGSTCLIFVELMMTLAGYEPSDKRTGDYYTHLSKIFKCPLAVALVTYEHVKIAFVPGYYDRSLTTDQKQHYSKKSEERTKVINKEIEDLKGKERSLNKELTILRGNKNTYPHDEFVEKVKKLEGELRGARKDIRKAKKAKFEKNARKAKDEAKDIFKGLGS